MTDDDLLRYFAGLFDGEGHVAIGQKRLRRGRITFTVGIVVQMADVGPLLLGHRRWGGTLRARRRVVGKRQVWRWCLAQRQSEPFFADILPFLIVKRGQVEAAVEFLRVRPSFSRGGTGLTLDERGMRAYYASAILADPARQRKALTLVG